MTRRRCGLASAESMASNWSPAAMSDELSFICKKYLTYVRESIPHIRSAGLTGACWAAKIAASNGEKDEMGKPKLYGISGSRALRAIWGIEEVGIDYEHVP